jgi:hypothetical protein
LLLLGTVIVVSGLAFCACGAWAFLQAGGNEGAGDPLSPIGFGLVFTLSGIFLVLFAFSIYPAMVRQSELETAHPDEPWLWRDDWAARRVRPIAALRSVPVEALLVILPVCAITGSTALVSASTMESSDGQLALTVAFLPIAGITLWLTLHSLRNRPWALRWFVVPTAVPIATGDRLEGTLEMPDAGAVNAITVELSCHTRSEERHRWGINEQVLWEDQRTLPYGEWTRVQLGWQVPLGFALPAEAPGTDGSDRARVVSWTLKTRTEPRTRRYEQVFELPVFEMKELQSNPSKLFARRFW